jgi:hypothetical protein
VTLMALSDPPDPGLDALLPVVRYAATQRSRVDEHGTGDYWDQATLVELAVIGGDRDAAEDAAATALSVVTEPWQPATTARNLRLIREAREARGEDAPWIGEIEQALAEAEARLMAPAQ